MQSVETYATYSQMFSSGTVEEEVEGEPAFHQNGH